MSAKLGTVFWSMLGLVLAFVVAGVVEIVAHYILEFRDNTLDRHDLLDAVGRYVIGTGGGAYAGIAIVSNLRKASLRFIFWAFVTLPTLVLAIVPGIFMMVLSASETPAGAGWSFALRLVGVISVIVGALIAYRSYRPNTSKLRNNAA